MTKEEIKNELDAVNIELRGLLEAVKDTSKDINIEEVKTNKAALEEKRSKLEKEYAEMDRPQETKNEEPKTELRKLAEGMVKRSAVTLNGTGTVNTVKELVKAITAKTDILSRARYFYGRDASTVIPVWPSHMTAAFVAEGGTVTQQSKTLDKTTIIPAQALSSLPVSNMTLDLSAANLEGELPELFNEAFGALMAEGMLTGDASTNKMQGIFTDANITKVEKDVKIADLAGFALDLRNKKYNNPVIVMSPTVYNAFIADASTGESVKIYKEDLIRNKSIEGVSIVLTPYAPTSVATAAICAVGGDLSNYAIGVAGQLKVIPKDTAGTDVTTFDASAYFNGKPIISADFMGFKVKA